MKGRMKTIIKILTPVHIGSGEELSPLEYFVDRERGFFHRLNMNSLFQDEKFRPFLNTFINEAARRRNIGDIVKDHSLLRRHILYSLSVSAEARQPLLTNPANVKTYIKSAGRVFIPGSSLKGSILSALLWFVLKEACSKDQAKKEQIQFLLSSRRNDVGAFDKLLRLAFPLIVPGSRSVSDAKFLRWLDVRDSSMYLPADSLQISQAKVNGARRGREIPIFYECLKEGQTFETEINCELTRFSEKEILQIIHDFYSQVAQKDGVKLPPASCLLRLGQGSTAYSTSLLLLAEDLGLRPYAIRPPRTRKRIAEKIPMGFVELVPA
jgi:CRISPR type III-A-associated RAMP protein Csm5